MTGHCTVFLKAALMLDMFTKSEGVFGWTHFCLKWGWSTDVIVVLQVVDWGSGPLQHPRPRPRQPVHCLNVTICLIEPVFSILLNTLPIEKIGKSIVPSATQMLIYHQTWRDISASILDPFQEKLLFLGWVLMWLLSWIRYDACWYYSDLNVCCWKKVWKLNQYNSEHQQLTFIREQSRNQRKAKSITNKKHPKLFFQHVPNCR